MKILIPNEKKTDFELYRYIFYYLTEFDLRDFVLNIGLDPIVIESFRDEEKKGSMSYVVIEEIKEITDIFPISIIDERIEEIEEELESLPDLNDKRDVERWIINSKLREELQLLRNIIEEELIERLSVIKGCVLVEIYENREACIEKLKELFPNYFMIE